MYDDFSICSLLYITLYNYFVFHVYSIIVVFILVSVSANSAQLRPSFANHVKLHASSNVILNIFLQ